MYMYVYASSLAYYMYRAIVLFSLRHNSLQCSVKCDAASYLHESQTDVFVLYCMQLRFGYTGSFPSWNAIAKKHLNGLTNIAGRMTKQLLILLNSGTG